LGAVNALAGAGKAASIDHRDEAAQEFEIQHRLSIRFSTDNKYII
jgi:hypothetical protein